MVGPSTAIRSRALGHEMKEPLRSGQDKLRPPGARPSRSAKTVMKPARPYSRHGLNAVKARVRLRGLAAIDMRTVAAREMLTFRDELVAALGGDPELSPQRRKLIDLAARTSLYLDHLDAWLTEQKTLIKPSVTLGCPRTAPTPDARRTLGPTPR